jgi:conjugative relaxase-like TrwC/TraI family protein
MLSIGKLTLRSLEYYLNLAGEDYYFKGGEPEGTWFESEASRTLGLTGVVEKDDLRNVFMGFHPRSGEPLVQNAGRTNGKRKRRPGFDLTCSAPKDVSCFVTTKIWESIRTIHRESVCGVLELLQETRAYIRVGSGSKGNCFFKRASIVAALFEHLVSREQQDPQLHTHALLVCLGFALEGKFGALHSPPFFWKYQRHFLGAYYRGLLAYRLWTDLQLETYREGTSFGVKGVPKSLVSERSKRRRQILAHMKKKGWSGGAAAAKATLATRRTKADIPPREELYKKWAKENKAHGLTDRAVRKMQQAKPRDHEKDLPRALAQAVDNMSRKPVSHFTEIELQIEALQEAPNWGLHPRMVLDGLAELMKTSDEIISLGIHNRQQRYTTKKILERERRLLTNCKHLRNASGPILHSKIVRRVLSKYRLTEEQRRAVEHLIRSPGLIRLLDGRAGTGKTSFVLKVCKEIWQQHGYRVIGATYTGKAAVELEEATGIPTETVHWQLADFKPEFGFNWRHHLKQFARAARGKRTYRLKRLKPVKIDKRTILIVDEFSQIDARHAEMITNLVGRGGGMLVATGDSRQTTPVGGQSPFRSLCNRMGCAEIEDIVRQKEKWARQVAKYMSEGHSGRALSMLAERGFVRSCEDMDDAVKMLVRDWSVQGVRRPERAPILAATNDEVEDVNDLCQHARFTAGVIGGKSAQIVDEGEDDEMPYVSRVYRGDRIAFTHNDRRLNVRNGFTGTVIGIDSLGRRISVQLDDGGCIIVPVKAYRHLRRGYALTVHRAQCGTYPECWVLAGPKQNLPTAYVSLSRAVLATYVYTSRELLDERLQNIENSPLAEEMRKMPDLRLASDLLEGVQPQKPTEQAANDTKPRTARKKTEGWWESKESDRHSEQPTPWWERGGTPAPNVVKEAAARREQKSIVQQNTAKGETLARVKRERTERELEEQRRYASGQWERDKVKREQAAARAALEKVMREHAEREREEQQQYAAAQAEAERRRRALLTQMFLVTSSVTEPRQMQAGNRDLLNSSISAMLSLEDAAAITQTQTANPIAAYFLSELFKLREKEEPITLEAEFVSVEEDAPVESFTPLHDMSIKVERPAFPPKQEPEPNSRSTTAASTSNYDTSLNSSFGFSSSSSSQPDYTSSSVSTYQSTSPYTDYQIQNMQMAAYQYTGAAQTAASQQANQTTTYTVTNQDR